MEKITCCEKVDRLRKQVKQNEEAISQLVTIISALNKQIKSSDQVANKFLI